MALQNNGPIKASEIQDEFGGTNPVRLSEYYGADTGVPTSGPIRYSDFYGTSDSISITKTVTEWSVNDAESTGSIIAGPNFRGYERRGNLIGNQYKAYGHIYSNAAIRGGGSMDSTSLNGRTIYCVGYSQYFSNTGPWSFEVFISGHVDTDFFESITPQDGDTFFPSDLPGPNETNDVGTILQYTDNGNNYERTLFRWNYVNKPSRWNGSGSSTVTFTYN